MGPLCLWQCLNPSLCLALNNSNDKKTTTAKTTTRRGPVVPSCVLEQSRCSSAQAAASLLKHIIFRKSSPAPWDKIYSLGTELKALSRDKTNIFIFSRSSQCLASQITRGFAYYAFVPFLTSVKAMPTSPLFCNSIDVALASSELCVLVLCIFVLGKSSN